VAAVNAYADMRARAGEKGGDFFDEFYAHGKVNVALTNVRMHLKSLGEPATKMYQGMLPLFPVIYRLEVTFDPERLPSPERLQGLEPSEMGDSVVWDSGLEPAEKQVHVDEFPLMAPGEQRVCYGWVKVHYQLHAWDQRQRREQMKAERWWRVRLL